MLDDYFKSLNIPPEDLVVISPDEGGIKRSLQHLNNLGGQFAIRRQATVQCHGVVQASLIGGRSRGQSRGTLFDDMISTAGSIVGAAQVAADHGAREIYLSASHAVFCGPAVERLSNAPIKEVVVTNSLSIPPEKRFDKLKTVTVAPLLGEAIRRIHRNESVSGLFG